jgi:hypothetical protein
MRVFSYPCQYGCDKMLINSVGESKITPKLVSKFKQLKLMEITIILLFIITASEITFGGGVTR